MQSNSTLLRKYGITQAQYQSLMRKQNGVCAICGRHQRICSLAVDHDHKTGKVRGLLCLQCNRGLGRFFDSPYRLRRAAEYIEQSRRASEEPATPPQVDQLRSLASGAPIFAEAM